MYSNFLATKKIEALMQRAINLALKTQHQTYPNPVVGALLVDQDGTILSEGYHRRAGEPHAEVEVLKYRENISEHDILFVTLEPCSHHGKTPPCVDLIIQKKLKHVVVGSTDPNPLVAGNGIKKLQDNGIKVTTGVLAKECRKINEVFNKHILTKLPFVSAKAALTLDGKIAMPSGESQWITGEQARQQGHKLRSEHQAIVVGGNTLLQDNPSLTDRTSINPRQPIRVVFSSSGEIPENCNFARQKEGRRILLAGAKLSKPKRAELESWGIEVVVATTNRPAIIWGLKQLYKRGVCSLLLEGGGILTASFLKERMIDKFHLFIAGKIIGASAASSWCGELDILNLADVPQLRFGELRKLGDDIYLQAYPQND